MHLPVCPACNLECGFCVRSTNGGEDRPGVSSFVLPANEVLPYVRAARGLCPELSVVGVAGPGDALVGDGMFRAFRAIGGAYPDLLRCLSTNGLLLDRRADELIALGIDTLTVTVNAIDPGILAQIVPALRYDGRRIEGEEGARILIRNQLAGIRRMHAAGVTIKVNTVLIPDINGAHIEDTARAVSEAGADMYNIIPLIPQHLFSGHPEPTCAEIEDARQKASRYADVFRHCRHCRADAVGIPGLSNRSAEVWGDLAGRADEVFSHG
jgi:nitrogen fixation protein NifB